MRWPRALGGILMALALAACGQDRADETGTQASVPNADQSAAPAEGAPPSAGVFDACASGAAETAACGSARVKALSAKVAEAYAQATAELSPEGRRIAADGARAWAQAQSAVCVAEAAASPPPQCFELALKERLQDAGALVRREGGYLFQRVETADAIRVTAAAAAEVGFGFGDGAPRALMRVIRYPRIDNPGRDAALERFNALVVPQRASGPQDLTEEVIDYAIAYAGPGLVSVRFTTFENALGAAHPNNGERAVNAIMPQAAVLRPETAFRANTRWQDALTARAAAKLDAAFEEFGVGPPDPSDVRDTATKAHNWVVTQDALILLFPPYSVGPHALGGHEVSIPWSDLRPYLNPSAPAPFGQGEG